MGHMTWADELNKAEQLYFTDHIKFILTVFERQVVFAMHS